jgi:hypothetical protein
VLLHYGSSVFKTRLIKLITERSYIDIFSSFFPLSTGSFFLIEDHVVEIILLKKSEQYHDIEVAFASKFSTIWRKKPQICKTTYTGRLFKLSDIELITYFCRNV